MIDLYTIDFEEVKPEEEEEKEEEVKEGGDDKLAELEEKGSEGAASRKASVKSVHNEKKPIVRFIDEIDVSERDDQGHLTKTIIKAKIHDGIKFEQH